MVVGLTYI